MTTVRFIDAPRRQPGETGAAFIERMLAQLSNKGSATALPTPPTIVIHAEAKPNAVAPAVHRARKRHAPDADRPPTDGRLEPLPPCKSPKAYTPELTPYEVWLEQRFKWQRPPMEPFGPTYPALPAANKWRKTARMRELTQDEKRAYGQTVLDGINALNAQMLARETPSFRSNSASGTFHNNGKDILAAINAQNRAAATR